MLQKYLNESLIQVLDDGHFEKLGKASEDLSKKLLKSKIKVVSHTLAGIDPNVPIENPEILEVKELIVKNWNTFVTNVKDTPLTYINGNCSAILGGRNNTVNHNDAAVFGNGVNSVSTDTFHVTCLNACGTPPGPGALPSGSIYYITAGAPIPPGARALYIVP